LVLTGERLILAQGRYVAFPTFITPKFAPSSTKYASIRSFELGMGWTMLDTRFFNGICHDVCVVRIVKGGRGGGVGRHQALGCFRFMGELCAL